jgi:hypothetical protein
VTAGSLVDEAVGWGIRRHAASALVTETVDQVLAAVPTTPGDPRVLAVIREHAAWISRGWHARVAAAGDRTLTEEEFKVQVRPAIEAERAQVHAPT